MPASDFAIVILAAGKGTRLRSNRAKVLHRAGGRALVEHVVRACQPLGAKKILAVVGHQADDVRAALEPLGVEAVLQQPQHGTGHALLVARRAIGNRVKHVLVLPGDAPLIGAGTLRSLLQTHRNSNAAATILTAIVENPAGYGRILRKSGSTVAAIVEESQLSEEQRTINEINSSMYCFALDKLWPALARLKPNNTHRELYLTDVIAVVSQQGDTVVAQVTADAQEVLGCNTRAELGEVDRILRTRKSAALMEAGVTIRLPESVVIDPDVQAGEDTVIEPCVQLLGKTRLGARCTIRTGSLLTDAQLADGVTIEPYSVIASSRIDSGAVVGPPRARPCRKPRKRPPPMRLPLRGAASPINPTGPPSAAASLPPRKSPRSPAARNRERAANPVRENLPADAELHFCTHSLRPLNQPCSLPARGRLAAARCD